MKTNATNRLSLLACKMGAPFSNKAFLCGAALILGILGGPKVQAQPAVEAWVQRYDGAAILAVSVGGAQRMAVDSSGNVTLSRFRKADFRYNPEPSGLVLQYSGAGQPLWTNRDLASADAVAVDGNGNVVVTGYSYATNGSVTATIKLSSAGIPVWTNLGPVGAASVVAVDGSGNVVVGGYLEVANGSGGGTIKYSGAGLPLWTNLVPSGDIAAIAVDGSGNVVVTTASNTFYGYYVYVTIKHSSAGVPLWTNLGPTALWPFDLVCPMAVDGDGNVVVTGSSAGTNGWDYATIKYSGTGAPLWTNSYEGGYGKAITVDSSDNVVVMGDMGFYSDWGYFAGLRATIKYSAAGVPLWTNRYPAGFHGDLASGLAVDANDDVVIAGLSATIKYSGAGIPLWTNYPVATALAVDGNGNVLVTDGDATTMAYSSAGVPLWTNRYIDSVVGGDDRAWSVALASNGTTVVTGSSYGTNGTAGATIAYSGAGAPLWTNRNSLEGVAVAVDSSGIVVVTGSSYLTNELAGSPGSCYTTIKYSGAGLPLWTNCYRGPNDSYARAWSVAADGSANVFVTGNSHADCVTIKYTAAGVPLWTNRCAGFGTGLGADGSGNVFVTGFTLNGSWDYDYLTIKYSGAGVPLWTNRYSRPGNNSDDRAIALAVDGSGNVVVTGWSATIKYSGAGLPLWTNKGGVALAADSSGKVFVTGGGTIAYSGTGIPLWTNLSGGAIAVDGSGNVVVTGDWPDGCVTTKYSGAGVPLWTNRYASGNATALAVDGSGNVVVTGYSINSDGSLDYLTIKYSPAGVPLLTIARTPTNTVTVSWPSAETSGFALEEASALAAPVSWTPNTAAVTDDGTNKSAAVPATNTAHFFRLRR